MGWLEVLIVLVAVGWVALGAGRRAFRLLTILAIASIVGGLIVFASKSSHRQTAMGINPSLDSRVNPDVITRQVIQRVDERLAAIPHLRFDDLNTLEPRVEVTVPRIRVPRVEVAHVDVPHVEFEPGFPFEHGMPIPHLDDVDGPPRWMMIALGTVLVIGGWMLFHRDRKHPVAMRGITVLGVAATLVILWAFVSHQPVRQISHSSDRVIKVSDEPAEPAATAPAVPVEKPHKAKRPSRAKAPSGRAAAPAPREVAADELPPRAGGIPVAAELAAQEKPAPASDAAPADEPAKPPAEDKPPAQPEPAPAAQPSEAVPQANPAPEPAKAAVPSGPAAEDKPTPEPAPAPVPTTPQPAPAPEQPASPESPPEPAKPAPEPASESAKPEPAKPEPAPEPAAKPPADTRPAAKDPAANNKEAVAAPSDADVVVDKDRPEWIEMPGKLVDSVYRVAVHSGFYVDVPECQRHLDEAIKQNADEYIDQFRGKGAAALVNIDGQFLNKHVKKQEYNEVRNATVGPMQQIHALLEYDDEARRVFDERWRQAVVAERLWYVGTAGAVVLALLTTLYGYLKLDLRTGPAHRGRLQLAATLFLLIFAAGGLLARWVFQF